MMAMVVFIPSVALYGGLVPGPRAPFDKFSNFLKSLKQLFTEKPTYSYSKFDRFLFSPTAATPEICIE